MNYLLVFFLFMQINGAQAQSQPEPEPELNSWPLARIFFDRDQDLRKTKDDFERYQINPEGAITQGQLKDLMTEFVSDPLLKFDPALLEDTKLALEVLSDSKAKPETREGAQAFLKETRESLDKLMRLAFGALLFCRILDHEAMKFKLSPQVSSERVEYAVRLILIHAARLQHPEAPVPSAMDSEKLYPWLKEYEAQLRFEITWEVRENLESEWKQLQRNQRTGRDLSQWRPSILKFQSLPEKYAEFERHVQDILQARHLHHMRQMTWKILFQKKYPDFFVQINRWRPEDLRRFYEDLKKYLFKKDPKKEEYLPFEDPKVQETLMYLYKGQNLNRAYRDLATELFRNNEVWLLKKDNQFFWNGPHWPTLDGDFVQKSIPFWIETFFPGLSLGPLLVPQNMQALSLEDEEEGLEERIRELKKDQASPQKENASKLTIDRLYFSFIKTRIFNLHP